MTRSVARCECCRADLLEYRPSGRIDIVVEHVSAISIDARRPEGIVTVLTCTCGTEREWTLAGRNRSLFSGNPEVHRVH